MYPLHISQRLVNYSWTVADFIKLNESDMPKIELPIKIGTVQEGPLYQHKTKGNSNRQNRKQD